MKINSKDFRVREAHNVNLRKWPTNVEPVYKSKEHYHKLLADHVDQLSTLQQLLYASNRYAALLIFQAMDAAGKDGAIKHVIDRQDTPWPARRSLAPTSDRNRPFKGTTGWR